LAWPGQRTRATPRRSTPLLRAVVGDAVAAARAPPAARLHLTGPFSSPACQPPSLRALALRRQKDSKDGRFTQVVSNILDTKMREDLERLKKIRNHRGLRHYWGVRVRGQHTKTTGRRGRTVGVSKKR